MPDLPGLLAIARKARLTNQPKFYAQSATINAAYTRLTIGINALVAMLQGRPEALMQNQQSNYNFVMYRGF